MDAVPDEDLMAYADGALPPAERARIEALLASDPSLQARLQPLVLARAGMKAIFGPMAREPVPPRLITAIQSFDPSGSASVSAPARKGWIEIFLSIGETLLLENARLLPVAAFSLAFLTAATTFWLLTKPSEAPRTADTQLIALDESGRHAVGDLAAALDTAPSGKALAAEAPESITPVLSFRSNDGRYCRQYKIQSKALGQTAGLACRSDETNGRDGTWRVVVHSESSPHAAQPGEFRPASGSGSPAVDAAVNALIEGDVLEPSDEAELIAKDWHIGPKR